MAGGVCVIRLLGAEAVQGSRPASGKSTMLLKDTYRDSFMIGATLDSEEKLQDLLAVGPEHFNAWTPENALKWHVLRPGEGEFEFSRADRYCEEASRFGMKAHGHTLVWFQVNPKWVFAGAPSRRRLLERMEEHIHTVGGHFRGRLHSWDVVNEAVSDEPGQRWRRRDHELYGVPRDPWLAGVGEDYVEQAFRFAQAACGEARLYYNEYFTVTPQDRSVSLAKVEKVCRLVRDLRDKGLRVDGVGIQGHWELGRLNVDDVARMIDRLHQENVILSVSELDIGVRGLWGGKKPPMPSLPAGLELEQALLYAKLFRVLRQHTEAIERVSFWGVSDAHTWKTALHGDDYPMIFDRQNRPKLAFQAVCDPEGFLREQGQ